jgi:hypothetical protein
MAYDIVKKIKAMVAKAESTDSMAEADTIMVMVREMLDKHGISLLSIRHTAVSEDPVGTSHEVDGFWAADNWVRKLSDAAASYYGVRVVWHKRGNYTTIAVIGRESCRAAFTAMLPYLRGQVRRFAQRGWANRHYASVSKGRTQIGLALCYRLYALKRAKEEAPVSPKQAAGLNMLVPVDEIEIELASAFPNMKVIDLYKKVARPSAQAILDAAEINLADQLRAKGAPVFRLNKA